MGVVKIQFIPRRPFFWPLFLKFFPQANRPEVVLAFGRKVYSLNQLDIFLAEHEIRHLKQQRFSTWRAIIWWIRYWYDPKFRYTQEAEAYRMQYRLFVKYQKDRNLRVKYADKLADNLSGPLYGCDVDKKTALKDITLFWV